MQEFLFKVDLLAKFYYDQIQKKYNQQEKLHLQMLAKEQATEFQISLNKNDGKGGREKQIQFLIHQSLQELQLKYQFKSTEDIGQLSMILNDILHYPFNQLAELHKQSNKLGSFDIHNSDDLKVIKSSSQNDIKGGSMYCPCCGFIKQEDDVKLCTNFSSINNVGISTFLFFQTVKNVIILLSLMAVIYSAYALGTNIKASNTLDNSLYVPADILSISLGAKQKYPTQTNKRYYYIQAWIGAGLIIVWIITFILLKYFENKQENRVQQQTKSASDFSFVIQNISSDVEKEDLQKQLDNYFTTITNVPQMLKKPFIIKKFTKGKPFFLNQIQLLKDQEFDTLSKDIQDLRETFRDWIRQRQQSATFSTTKEQRMQSYKKYDQLIKKKTEKLKQVAAKIQENYKKSHKHELTTIFVTLDCTQSRQLICSQNPYQFSARIRYYLTCCKNQNRFQYTDKNGNYFQPKIYRAPQPQDIIWANIGIPDSQKIKKKIHTYFITFVFLGISFACVYGLSLAQTQSSKNRVLSFVISLLISVINTALGQIIRRLTIYEADYTQTNHQTSLAIKSVLAQLINSIMVPIFANYFIKQNIYDTNGLAEDIFYLSITSSFLPPILKIIDVYYYYTRIWAWWSKKPKSRMYLNQSQLNVCNELMLFEVGYQYIYIVNLYLYTCYFVSLQPIIVVFAIGGLVMMYWAQKYVIFTRSKRPVPGTNLINTAMSQWILFGAIVYVLGSLTWSNFSPGGVPSQAILPNLVALAFAIFLLIAPYQTIFDLIFQQQATENLLYDQNRIYLPSQYDRLNPATSEQAFKEYMTFIQKTKEDLKNASEEKKRQMSDQFRRQLGRGNRQNANIPLIPSIAAQFFNPNQNAFNGGFRGNMFFPQNNNLNMPFTLPNNNFQPINNNSGNQQFNMNQMGIQPNYNRQQQFQTQNFQQPQQQSQFGNQPQKQSQFGYPQQQSQFGFPQQQSQFENPQQNNSFQQLQFNNNQFEFQQQPQPQSQRRFGNGQFGFQQNNPFNSGNPNFGFQMSPFNTNANYGFNIGGFRRLF